LPCPRHRRSFRSAITWRAKSTSPDARSVEIFRVVQQVGNDQERFVDFYVAEAMPRLARLHA